MPQIGSQITICDLPVRFDTYSGCTHACRYCFVNRKRTLSNVGNAESALSLEHFINGSRTQEMCFIDWNIPIHFGGTSDPFQPAEIERKRTLDALKVLQKYNYPFVISTKNKMIADEPYFSILKECNVVIQISAACQQYDDIEVGASRFNERIEAIQKIAPYKRVIVRIQPYFPMMHFAIMKSLKTFANAGVYGVTVESIKYITKMPGTIKLGADNVYPCNVLRPKFEEIKEYCHQLGMRFYCAENRLRSLGDDLCCCGVDGLGWQVNTANLNHLLYDKQGIVWTKAQETESASKLLNRIKQDSISQKAVENMTYKEFMLETMKIRNEILPLLPENYKHSDTTLL